MVKGLKIDWKQSSILAGVITAAVFAVSYVFNLLGTTVQPLFSSLQPISAVTGTIGDKIIGLISGIIPIGDLLGFGIFSIFLSSLVIVILGEYAIDNLKLPAFKGFAGINGRIGRIASVIIYGSIPVYLVLLGMTGISIGSVIGVGIHTLMTAAIAVWIANIAKLKI